MAAMQMLNHQQEEAASLGRLTLGRHTGVAKACKVCKPSEICMQITGVLNLSCNWDV